MGKIQNNFNAHASWILMFLFLCLNISATTRIAIVSEKSNILSDLLTADLSDVKDVELLERSEIRKIFKEHRISAVSFSCKQALSLNKLLKADLLVVIESEKEGDSPIGIVVFDAKTGVRYQDCALPDEEVDKVAKFAADAVRQALEKREKASEGKLQYISLLSVRNADLPRNKAPFCKAVGILLMRQLGNAPNIVVLEREYLNWLNTEHSLPGMKWKSQLLASNILLEMAISKPQITNDLDNSEKNKQENLIKCSLYFNEGQKLTVTGSLHNPVELVNELTTELTGKIKLLPIKSRPDIKREARRFYCAYKFFKGHRQLFDAYEKIESAYALNPGLYLNEYIFSLEDAGMETIRPGSKYYGIYWKIKPDENKILKALDMGERVLDLCAITQENKLEHMSSFIRELELVDDRSYSKSTKTRIKNLKFAYKKYQDRRLRKIAEIEAISKLKNWKEYEEYTKKVYYHLANEYHTSKKEYLKAKISHLNKWLDISANFINNHVSTGHSTLPKSVECLLYQIYPAGYHHPWDWNRKTVSEDILLSFKTLYNKMQKHPSLPIKLIARKSLLGIKDFYTSDTKGKVKDKILSFCMKNNNVIIEALNKLGKYEDNSYDRFLCYQELCFPSIDNDFPPEETYKIRKQVFNFMLNTKELEICTIRKILPPFDRNIYNKQSFDMCNDLLDLYNSGQYTLLNSGQLSNDLCLYRIKQHLLGQRRIIIAEDPKVLPEAINWHKRMKNLTNCYKNKNSRWSSILALRIVDTDKLYALGKGKNGLELLTISIPDGTVTIVRKIPMSVQFEVNTQVNRNSVCIYKNLLILAADNGIYIIDINGQTNPIKIDNSNGLPSTIIQSICVTDDMIYMCVGNSKESHQNRQSFILSYCLKNGEIEILANSKRKDKISPFDNINAPISITSMCPDPVRSRILMAAKFYQNDAPHRLSGLWEYNYESKKWKQLATRKGISDGYEETIEQNGELYQYSSGVFCALLHPESDRLELIYSEGAETQKYIKGDSKLINRKQGLRPPFLITDNYLWSGSCPITSFTMSGDQTIGRIALDGASYEFMPHMDKIFCLHITYMKITPDYQYLLLCNGYDLWLIDLNGVEL